MDKLRPKYYVAKLGKEGQAGTTLPDSTDPDDVTAPFVLIPGKDPAAFHAMLAYAEHCEKELAIVGEILDWLAFILESLPQLGTQGRRNLALELGAALDNAQAHRYSRKIALAKQKEVLDGNV